MAQREKTATLAEELATALLLEDSPVGVRVFRDPAAFDACDFPVPPVTVHYCTAVKFASEGMPYKLGAEHIRCNTAPRTLGMESGFRDPEFVESYVSGGLYGDIDRAADILSDVATLDGTCGVAVGPLEAFTDADPPDVVIVATPPYGAMRVAQAVTYNGDRVHSGMIGMHGICSESTAAPASTGKVCTSLLCSGTRHVADWADDLLSVGIPYGRLPEVVQGLCCTAERYEPDERKAKMRGLTEQTAYFYGL